MWEIWTASLLHLEPFFLLPALPSSVLRTLYLALRVVTMSFGLQRSWFMVG